jgi:hypothetical protein
MRGTIPSKCEQTKNKHPLAKSFWQCGHDFLHWAEIAPEPKDIHDRLFHSRSLPHRRGRHHKRRTRQHAAYGQAGGGCRLYPFLAGRTSWHEGHRQRRHVAGHRRSRPCDEHHPHRFGRHHAAKSLAAGHRRAVRHARGAVPGPCRPRPRPCAGYGHEHRARTAPQPGSRRQQLPRRHCGVAILSRRTRRAHASRRYPAPARTSRSGFWDQASTAPISRPHWGFPTPLHRISHPTC